MKNGKKFASYLSIGLGILALPQLALAATFTVTNTNDSGAGSLRQAITNANATPASTINFNITGTPPGGVWTIQPLSSLPTIVANNTLIDGNTQTTFGGNTNVNGPEVVLKGSSAGSGSNGFTIGSNNCLVRGLVINGFSNAGVSIQEDPATSYATPTGNKVQSCYIGTDPSGTTATPNTTGVSMDFAASSLIGGTTAALRNIISGNSSTGVSMTGPGALNAVQGNYIGTSRTGIAQLGNGSYGVYSGFFIASPTPPSTQDFIGGSSTAAGNVISGSFDSNIYLGQAQNLVIQNNNIGTQANGINTLTSPGIQQNGISVSSVVGPVTIGGSATTRNVIGDHYYAGIVLQGSSYVNIQSNYIGLGRNGTSNVGNNGFGIETYQETNNVLIGGASAALGNVICNNGQTGIDIDNDDNFQVQVAIRANSIYNNAGLGIDLGNNGVTPNDTLDPDSGANRLQNFPVLSTATSTSTASSVTGTLNSLASTTFTLDFFSIPALDSGGYGEGRVYLGSKTVTTNSSGNASFTFSGPVVSVGQFITATATGTFGTSEFCLGKVVTAGTAKAESASGNNS